MNNPTTLEMFQAQWAAGKHLCIGLDPDKGKMPLRRIGEDWIELVLRFLGGIIEVTADIACCYKPNRAFFEQFGDPGFAALRRIYEIIRVEAPQAPTIDDGKRGDIGNTNNGYVTASYAILGADAVTLSPFLGQLSLKPFLEDHPDRLHFLLCRTSNKGADEFQNLPILLTPGMRRPFEQYLGHEYHLDSVPQYQWIAYRIASRWNEAGNCGLVVGATAPEELRVIRETAPDLPLLIPGIGTQGGDLELSVHYARHRFVMNASSSILYAFDRDDETSTREFAAASRQIAQFLHDSITEARPNVGLAV